MGEMRVLSSAGDIVVEWDADDPASVERAKGEWDRLKADGYEFFEPVESKGKRVQRFDKALGKVIAAPGVQSKQDKAADTRPAAMSGGPAARVEKLPPELEACVRAAGKSFTHILLP